MPDRPGRHSASIVLRFLGEQARQVSFVKLLHTFEKRTEIERVIGRQSVPLELSNALPLLREVASSQSDMPSHHADIVGKCHQREQWCGRDVPLRP